MPFHGCCCNRNGLPKRANWKFTPLPPRSCCTKRRGLEYFCWLVVGQRGAKQNIVVSNRIECDPWPWAPALTVSVRAGPVRARWASSSVSLPSRTAASEGTPPVESSSAVPCESPDLPPGRYHCRWCRSCCCCCYYCFRLCMLGGQGVFLCRRMWFLWRFVGWRNANC